jgi:hypothetical protein
MLLYDFLDHIRIYMSFKLTKTYSNLCKIVLYLLLSATNRAFIITTLTMTFRNQNDYNITLFIKIDEEIFCLLDGS